MKTQLLTILSLALVLSACGGDSKKGGSQTSSPSGNTQSSIPVVVASSAQAQSSAATNPTPLVGVFVDAFVAGIGYRTETRSGVTNERGEFNYLPGETVTFFIGDLVFPPVPAKGTVTPLDMAQTLNPASPVVLNIARLLQSLDTDGNPANGISISPTAAQSAASVDFNLGLAQFAALPSVANLVANSGSVNITLVSVQQALTHLRDTLIVIGVPIEESSSSAHASSESQASSEESSSAMPASSAPVVTRSSTSSADIAVSSEAASSTSSTAAMSSSSMPTTSSAVESSLASSIASSELSSSVEAVFSSQSSLGESSTQSSSSATAVVSSSRSSSLSSRSSSSVASSRSSAASSLALSSSSSSSSSVAVVPDFNQVYGFASLNGGTTGGAGAGSVTVAVCTGADLTAALNNPAYSGKPLTIYVDGVITWHNAGNSDIKLNRPNVSIIGRGADAGFWGTGIHITASNVIIRNLKMYKVPQTRGQGDIITIDGRNGPVRNVWIDHNEMYNDLDVTVPASITDPVAQGEYKKDYYDELVSGRSDVADITISYNYLHDSWKTSLWGSSDEDNFDRRITWHHNYWHHVNSRLPLFRFGKGHIYNNYYHNVDTSAINSRMGAIIRVERNVFENTKNPVMSQDSIAIGYWELIENQLRGVTTWVDKEGETNIVADELLADHTSTGTLVLPEGYRYAPSLIPVEDVPAHVQEYAGIGVLDTGTPTLACVRPEWDIEPPPPSTNEPETADPSSVNWNLYNGNASPFDATAITLADNSQVPFVTQGTGNDFTATGTGAVLFDSTALGTNNHRARISNVGRNDGVYPKYFTLIAGIKGFNPPANARVLDLETTFGGTADTTASRLKVVLRSDGASNFGVQFEGSPAPNTAYGLAMNEYRVYHFTVALSSPTTGWARAYLDGSSTPVLNQEEVQFSSTTKTNNYLQIGDGGTNSYKALIDWMVWTDAGAYTPAQLAGKLPANIGCVKGYGASENLANCDFTGIGVSSSSESSTVASSSAGSTASDSGSAGSTSSTGVVVGSSAGGTSSTAATSSSTNSSSVAPVFACSSEPGLYFCDDFAAGSGNWDFLNDPASAVTTTPTGTFDVLNDAGDNNVLRYTAASRGGVLALVKPSAFTGVTSGDYYVEARIRPRNNATTGNKQLYIIARAQDASNWYGAGFNVQGANTSTRVAIGKMVMGAFTDNIFARYNTPLDQGVIGGTDGTWYKVRLEMKGTEIKVYYNDLLVISGTDTSFASAGMIGFYTTNKSFEIDDIKVGNADDKPPVPSQLTISPTANYSAEVGDAARAITVFAKNQQSLDDTFTVESSNPAVVSVSTSGYMVNLEPVGEGSATITFTSGSDPTLTRTLSATIAPQFVMPIATYNLSGLVTPAASETNVYADTSLTLIFDSPPALGTAGAIRIFKSSDDTVVDTIKLVDHQDAIGYGAYRTPKTRPISISGNTATIALQSKKLEYNTSYYVAVSASAFTGATLATLPFEGIGKNAGWTFTTKPAPATNLTSLTVDDTGTTADFRTLQGALNYVMQNLAKSQAATITVNNGIYNELLYLRNKDNLSIIGESREGVLIQYQNSEAFNTGSSGRSVFLVELADMLTLENLTLKNTTIKTAELGQAEAIYFNSTGRLVAKNANFISEQDTLQLKGYSWFYRTLVAGNVDFIWGNNNVSLFEESEIRSLGDSSNASNGGYVVQARTLGAADKGFVFLNSNLTQGTGPTGNTIPAGKTYLARTGGTGVWDNVVFINSRMGTHVNTAGWYGVSNVTPTATTGWREFATMDADGNTISLTGRIGGYELSLAEVASNYCNRAQIFAAYNSGAGWDPLPGDTTDCVNFGHSSSSVAGSSSDSSVSSSTESSTNGNSSSAASSMDSETSSDSSSSTGSSLEGEGSSSSAASVAPVIKTWGFDSAAYATADTSLFNAAYSAATDNGIKATNAEITVDGLVFYSTTASVLRYRPAGSANNATANAFWNTNGSFFTSNATAVSAIGEDLPSNVRAYIAIPVEAGKALSLSISYRQTGNNTVTAGKFALVGSDGKVLAVKDASYASAGAGDSITLSLDASHTQTAIKLIYGREGLSSGGVNILEMVRHQ